MRHHHFLAVHELPPGTTPEGVRAQLERVAEASHALGLHPAETFYSFENGRAYTRYDAGDAVTIRMAYETAGLPPLEIVPGDQIYTDLLDAPRRAR